MMEECSERFQVFGPEIILRIPRGTLYNIQSDRGSSKKTWFICPKWDSSLHISGRGKVYYLRGHSLPYKMNALSWDHIVCDLVSVSTVFCWIVMKLFIGILYKKPPSRFQYHANPHSDSYTLLKGINEFLLHLFLDEILWNLMCVSHIMPCWTSASFTEIRAVNAVLDLRVEVRVFLRMYKGWTIWHYYCIGWMCIGIVTMTGAAAVLTGVQVIRLYRFFFSF
jgi:hypothetical protein